MARRRRYQVARGWLAFNVLDTESGQGYAGSIVASFYYRHERAEKSARAFCKAKNKGY